MKDNESAEGKGWPKDGFALRWCILAPQAAVIDFLRVKNLSFGLLLAFSLLLSPACVRADSGWVTDYKKAQAEAKTNHRLVFLNFTGSDWCGYCIQLDRAILSKPEFKDYAGKNLVLVEIDFPSRNGARWKAQSLELKKQNMALAEKYQIEGFPTLVVLDGEGKTLWKFEGYYSGGLAAFLAELDRVRKG